VSGWGRVLLGSMRRGMPHEATPRQLAWVELRLGFVPDTSSADVAARADATLGTAGDERGHEEPPSMEEADQCNTLKFASFKIDAK
jgi:hypothetical protein